MQVPKEILKDWKTHKSNGDLTRIATAARKKGGVLSNTAASTVSDVFQTGKCRFELFRVIAAFYKNRKATISKLTKEVA